jgi:hypothetical protein
MVYLNDDFDGGTTNFLYWAALHVTTHAPAPPFVEAMPPAHGSSGLRPLHAHPCADATGVAPSGQRSATSLALLDLGLQMNPHCLRSIMSWRLPSTQIPSS